MKKITVILQTSVKIFLPKIKKDTIRRQEIRIGHIDFRNLFEVTTHRKQHIR